MKTKMNVNKNAHLAIVSSHCVTLVHYCEKLMGVVVFAKVQGPKGSADFQTLQVCRPL
jgi:hypothetical protein